MSSSRCFRNTFTEPAAIDEAEARKGIARAILEGIDVRLHELPRLNMVKSSIIMLP